MKTACIYHAECVDGAASAAAVAYKYPDVELFPAIHGEPAPTDLDDKRVFIVDFSFPAEVMQRIQAQAAEVFWYDHHKTAIPIQEEVGFGIIDLAESGATLTWKQLFPEQEVPKISQYVRDKDIWVWELPESREISHAIREMEGILDPKSETWKHFLNGLTDHEWLELIQVGKRSRRLLQERFEKAATKGKEITLRGHRALAVNWTDDSSEIGEYIYKVLGYPVALIFSFTGKNWSFSLRSNTVDVADIAISFGGGGHPGAAGFRTDSIEWLFTAHNDK